MISNEIGLVDIIVRKAAPATITLDEISSEEDRNALKQNLKNKMLKHKVIKKKINLLHKLKRI